MNFHQYHKVLDQGFALLLFLFPAIMITSGLRAQCTVGTPSICVVSVDDKGDIVVSWEKENMAMTEVDSFMCYRLNGFNYEVVGTVDVDSLSMWTDKSMDPQQGSYTYGLSVMDSCETLSGMSPVHTTMHLQDSLDSDGCLHLYWNDYVGINFSEVIIWEDANNDGNFQRIDTVPAGEEYYPVWSACAPFTTPPTYFVEVETPDTCTSTRAKNFNSTRSNRQSTSGPASVVSQKGGEGKMFLHATGNGRYMLRLSDNYRDQQLEVLDAQGRLIHQETFSGREHVFRPGGDQGMYFLRVTHSKGAITRKFIDP